LIFRGNIVNLDFHSREKNGHMAKFYSSLFFLLIFFPSLLIAQNVGIGTSDPREKLEVAGAIMIGTTTGNLEGTIRFNRTINKFEGRDTVSWNPFGGSGSGESLWTKDGINIYPDTPQYSGNVGIGTIVPLTKLHVKGNGNIAIRAETANDTLPALDVINTAGMGLKVTTYSDSIPGAWFYSDSSTALYAETKSGTFPAGMLLNKDSAGYALKVVSWAALDTISGEVVGSEGGNAMHVVGDLNIWGAIRNTDSTLYGGSVAINDGVTVGDIAGASCTPVTDTSVGFDKDFGSNFEWIQFGLNNNEIFNNIIVDDSSNDCRSITKVYVEVKAGDDESFPLEFEAYVRGQYIGGIDEEPSANLSNNMPLPPAYPGGHYISGSNAYESTLCGCYTSSWGFETNIFNGEDPNDVGIGNNNWYIQFNSKSYYDPGNSYDGDYLFSYSGTIFYKWGDTIQAPAYASYGDIRASGSIYANSDDLLGDVAEYFKVSAARQPEVGDIVSISRKDPQTFELASVAYDPLVVGVVSENPSVHLNDPKSGSPIGLTGRVKVKVNLMGGMIQIGDPITSSSVEGVGMKASDAGTIVGYALEAFDGSRNGKEYGYIIILLARGHVEKLNQSVKVEEINQPTYGGMIVKGSMKVTNDQKIVLVPWDAVLAQKIPSDVEFDDLFVELMPFGGDAEMIVKDVNAKGIMVEIIKKSDGFKGFYYKTDIVTSMIESFDNGNDNVNENASAAVSDYTYEERVSRATELYREWKEVAKELQQKSMSLAPLQNMTSGKQVSLYKKEVAASIQRNAPELYAQWQSLGSELSRMVNNDQSIMKKAKEAN